MPSALSDIEADDRFPHGHFALAVELRPGTLAGRLCLSQSRAGELAERMAEDLALLVPAMAGYDLAVLGGHFDPVELLRPGWPVHAALRDVLRQAPEGGAGAGRVIAVGGHGGRLPGPFSPDPNQVGGALRLLPATVSAAAGEVLGGALESVLLERGMAGAATALMVQEAFGAEVEHVRYLSLHDLLALTAMQYQHAGLAGLWPLIEAALLAPWSEEWLDAPPEPLFRHVDGELWLAELDFEAWAEAGFAPSDTTPERWPERYRHYLMRRRQLSAVLAAHGLRVHEVPCSAGSEPRARLRAGG